MMNAHTQADGDWKETLLLTVLVFYVVAVHRGNIFHQPHSAGSRCQKKLQAGQGNSFT